MEKGNFHVVEWTIDNFSCWNGKIHNKVITSPKSPYVYEIAFHLFPRGLSGRDEHLVTYINSHFGLVSPRFSTYSGELSFIGSDGSLLYQQHVDSNGELDVIELPPGPKFQEVVVQIRKNEDIPGDRLTLRFKLKKIGKNDSVEYMRTTIDAFKAFIKITPNMLKYSSLQDCVKLYYPTNKDIVLLRLFASKNRSNPSQIELTLERDFGDTKELVIICMSVLNNKNIVRKEEIEHLFRYNGEKWTFSNSLTSDEIANEGLAIILTIKIIPTNSYTRSVGLKLYYTDAVQPIKLSELKPAGKSVTEENFSKSRFIVSSNQTNNSVGVLTKELMRLYQDQDFSDFQLKCGDVSIPVHKNILSARSPVFKTMLSCDMREAASGCMDIEDLDPSTLAHFLTFLYTGAVEDLESDRALKLYYAADKYQVPSLKRECVSVLGSSMSISNVCDILSLADKHQDDLLISAAHDFVLEHYNDVLRSQEWKSFMKSEPVLVAETLTHLAGKNFFVVNKET